MPENYALYEKPEPIYPGRYGTLGFRPKTWGEAAAFLGSREEKKVGNNRWLVRPSLDSSEIAFVLHSTEVVTFTPRGEIILNTGGYRTVTTKAAINEIIVPLGFRLSSDRGRWIIEDFRTDPRIVAPYFDGLTLYEGRLE
jgi:hypothetical protein